MSKSKTATKTRGKRTSKATDAQRTARRVKADNGKVKSVATATAALVAVGSGAKGHTIIGAQQLADAMGVDGKRLRGWLRTTEVLGNDGKYSRYAIDLQSKEGKGLVQQAMARFKVSKVAL